MCLLRSERTDVSCCAYVDRPGLLYWPAGAASSNPSLQQSGPPRREPEIIDSDSSSLDKARMEPPLGRSLPLQSSAFKCLSSHALSSVAAPIAL